MLEQANEAKSESENDSKPRSDSKLTTCSKLYQLINRQAVQAQVTIPQIK